MRQEVFLTTFEMMQTQGFIFIMSIIWGTGVILGLPLIYILKKTAYKGKH